MLCYGVVVVRVAIVPSAEESRGWGLGAQQPQPLTVCPLPPLGLGHHQSAGSAGRAFYPTRVAVTRHLISLPCPHDTGHTQPGPVLGQILQDVSSSCVVGYFNQRSGMGCVHHSPAGEGSPLPSTLHHYCWDNGRDKYWMLWGLGGQGVGLLLSPNK